LIRGACQPEKLPGFRDNPRSTWQMLPTPDLSHLKSNDYELVYEPAEDTFLLLDALEADADRLRGSSIKFCLEVGSGSGCVSTFLNQILGNNVVYLCTDINEQAASCTMRTAKQNKTVVSAVVCDLAAPLASRLGGIVDLLIFNPPYVPTEEEEASAAAAKRSIESSWAGGSNGMSVTNRLLRQVEVTNVYALESHSTN